MTGEWTQLDSFQDDPLQQALVMDFTVGGVAWADDTIVMMWVTFEDPEEPERKLSWTCTTQYSQQSIFSSYVEVLNYNGTDSFSVLNTGRSITHDQVNVDDLVDLEADENEVRNFWRADINNLATEYGSSFSKGVSTQSCGAVLTLKLIDEDETEPGLQNTNNNILNFATRYIVSTGWKTWDYAEEEFETSGEGDGTPFNLELYPPFRTDASGDRITNSPVKWMNEFEARKGAFDSLSLSFALGLCLFLFY